MEKVCFYVTMKASDGTVFHTLRQGEKVLLVTTNPQEVIDYMTTFN